jgi:hypothetical protein
MNDPHLNAKGEHMRLPVFAIVLVMSPFSVVAETPKTFAPAIVSPEKGGLTDPCAAPQKILRYECVKGGVTGSSRQEASRTLEQRNTRQSHNSAPNRPETGIRSERVERYEQQFTQRGNLVQPTGRPVKPIKPGVHGTVKPGVDGTVKPWKPDDRLIGDPSKPTFPVKPIKPADPFKPNFPGKPLPGGK